MSSNGTAASTLQPLVSPSPATSQRAASSPPLPSVTPSPGPTSGPAPSSPPANSPTPNPPSSQPPPASSAPPPASSAPPPASSQRPASSAPPQQSSAPPAASSAPPIASTRVVIAPSATPSVEVVTSFITPTPTAPGETPAVVVITSTVIHSNESKPSNAVGSLSASPSTTDPTQLQGARKEGDGGLSTGGKTAIAVVIPVVVVALLVLGAILFWRRRKQRKDNEDERRKEVEEYGYNPNHDPTLPAVGMTSEMAEDSSGYRGWGNTTTSSNRKASTTLTSGMTYSDSNSNPGGYQSPHSPTHGTYSDVNSNDPLVNGRRETLDSDGIAALGAAPNANKQTGVHRGPSNASSSYSAAGRSDNSGEYPGMPTNNPQEYYDQGYYQSGPYGSNNAYDGAGQQPIIRDVSARRNTRIENPTVLPQQGNSGVSTNF